MLTTILNNPTEKHYQIFAQLNWLRILGSISVLDNSRTIILVIRDCQKSIRMSSQVFSRLNLVRLSEKSNSSFQECRNNVPKLVRFTIRLYSSRTKGRFDPNKAESRPNFLLNEVGHLDPGCDFRIKLGVAIEWRSLNAMESCDCHWLRKQ